MSLSNNSTKIFKSMLHALVLGGVSAFIVSCGGSGGSSSPLPIPGGDSAGVEGTGGGNRQVANTSVGTVDLVPDGIKVNGVEYDINQNTTITIDGVTAIKSDIQDGQVALVEGDIGTESAIANSIAVTFNVLGPITSIDTDNLIILGQTIRFNEDVLLGGLASNIADLAVGDIVLVSGLVLSDGSIDASRLDEVNAEVFEVAGFISDLDQDADTFRINNLIVHFDDLSTLEEGQKVKVTGKAFNGMGQFIATELQNLGETFSEPGDPDQVELEGFVTQLDEFDDYRFTLGDTPVIASRDESLTKFVGGSVNSLKLDARLEVEGTLDEDGNLLASRIIFLAAELLYYKDGDQIESSDITFRWNDAGADGYRFRIQSYGGDLYVGGYNKVELPLDGDTTEYAVSGLPENGTKIVVRLYSRFGDRLSEKNYVLEGMGLKEDSELISPVDGAKLDSSSAEFSWKDVQADAYRLKVHDTREDLYDETFEGDITSAVVSNLPTNGARLGVELYTRHGDWWKRESYEMTSQQLLVNAELTSHEGGDKLKSAESELFTWNDVGAEQYRLELWNVTRLIFSGTFPAGTTSVIVEENLPRNNALIQAVISSYQGGGWASQSYSLTGVGLDNDAALSSHNNNSQLSSSNDIFTWNEVPDAEEYRLVVWQFFDGKRQNFFAQEFDSHVTSVAVPNLPKNNAYIRVDLSTQQNGFIARNEYDLRGPEEKPTSTVIGYSNNDTVSRELDIAWTDVGADEYVVAVLDRRDYSVIYEQYFTNADNSINVTIPEGLEAITIAVGTNFDGWWSPSPFLQLHIEQP